MKPFDVAIELDGRRHAGTWVLRQGAVLRVACAWGAGSAEIGTAKPEAAARELLAQIVREGQARHAEREAAYAAFLESLGRKPRR